LKIYPSGVTENLPSSRLHRFLLRSSYLPDDREITVYLPGVYYAEPGRRFPVFYLHDGQNLFDPRTSYIPGHTWQAHATADRLTASGEIAPLILVGVAHTGVHRISEYTPTEDPASGGGQGGLYGRLLVDELKPFLDASFRTRPEAESTGLGGSSLGGLISLFLGLEYPRIFGRLALLSPSVWWDRRSILNLVATRRLEFGQPPPRIWLDIGSAEGARHLRDTAALHELLLTLGWRDEIDLRFRRFEDAAHNEDAWADRFDQVLRFLFPAITP
jgi:predicted alpha/beta superfamily hydrolase